MNIKNISFRLYLYSLQFDTRTETCSSTFLFFFIVIFKKIYQLIKQNLDTK